MNSIGHKQGETVLGIDMTKYEDKIEKVIEYLLFILIFVTPLSRSGVNIFTFLLFVAWLVKKVLFKNKNLEYINITKWLLIYGMFNLLTLFNAVNIYGGLSNFVDEYLKYSLTFIIALDILKSRKQFKIVFILIPISAALVTSYGFYQYHVMGIARINSTFSNSNPAGTYFMLISLLAAGCIIFLKNRIGKFIAASLILSGLIALTYTGSRGAMVGFIGGFLLICYIIYRVFTIKQSWPVFLIMLIVVFVIINIMPGNIVNRFARIKNLNTLKQRFLMYKSGIKMILDHPLLGIGRGQFRYTYPHYKIPEAKNFTHIHNFYLHMIAEIGIPGFLIFLVILKKILYNNIKKWHGNNLWFHYSYLVIVGGVAVHNLFDWTFLHSQIGIYLIIFTAMWLNNINYKLDEILC